MRRGQPEAPPHPPGRPETAEPLVRPSAVPSRNAPTAAISSPRPMRPVGSSRTFAARDRDNRNEQHRADAEQQQQRIAEIGARASEPVRGRPAGGGAQRGIGRAVRRQRNRRRQAQQQQHRAPGADREPAHGIGQRLAPVRCQFALRRARGNGRHVPPPEIFLRQNPPRGVPGQAKSWRHCDERVSGARDGSRGRDHFRRRPGRPGARLRARFERAFGIVVDPADPAPRTDAAFDGRTSAVSSSSMRMLDGDRRCRPSRRAGLPDPADRGRRRAGARRAAFRSRR